MEGNSTPQVDIATSTMYITNDVSFFAVFNIMVGMVGLTGNTIVCLTVYRSRFHHDITHYLIASLAISDLFCCLFFIISILFSVDGKYGLIPAIVGGFMGEIFCRLFWSLHLFWSAFFSSAFNLVVVTFERYYAIVHPLAYARFFTVRRGLMLAGVAWALGYLLEIEFPIRYYFDDEKEICVFAGLGPIWFQKLSFLKSFIISFLVPLVLLVWAYYKIIKTLREGAANPERQGGMAGQQGAEMYLASRRVVQSLLIITTLFILFLLPTDSGNVLLFLEVPVDVRGSTWEAFRTLTVMNSVVNPMIYAIKMKKFRRAMKSTLCPCVKTQVRPDDATDSSLHVITSTISP